jgi:hypothetical protein
MVLAPLLLAGMAGACSSADSGTIQILTTNADTFTGPPAVATLTVLAIDTSGDPPTMLATGPISAATIDLGQQNESEVAALQVTGADANGVELVSGASLPVEFGELTGVSLPIFVQRVGQLVPLPPGPQGDARQAPTIAQFEGQYLFIGGGSDPSLAATSQIYDFAQFALLPQPPTLPRVPLSVAFVGTVALLIDGSGSATYFDFSDNSSTEATDLAGGSFADVAGGTTVISDLGSEFIVGATRTGSPSRTVLEINPNDTSNANYPNGNLTWLFLTEIRQGAAAAWVSGFGLVVAGGSTTASGAELFTLPSTSSTTTTGDVATSGKALPFPPDPSVGAGATAVTSVSASTVLLAGGIVSLADGGLSLQDAGVRIIDVGCPSNCSVITWETALPEPIVSAQAFSLPSGGAPAFVVGNDPLLGITHAFLLTTTAATEVPLNPQHMNATATLSPVGSIVIVGGADDIQSFVPAP